MTDLTRQLATLVAAGDDFTSDDLTTIGAHTLDAAHAPNGANNGIGGIFSYAAKLGRIETVGYSRSRSPHRKGGLIRVWRGTASGRLWATSVLRP